MSVFLDTDVLVDCLRGTKAAEEWLESNPRESFQIPGIVAMELIIGCQNKAALKRTQKLLQSFEIAWPEARSIQLYSFNLRDFGQIEDLDVKEPIRTTCQDPG